MHKINSKKNSFTLHFLPKIGFTWIQAEKAPLVWANVGTNPAYDRVEGINLIISFLLNIFLANQTIRTKDMSLKCLNASYLNNKYK